MRCSAPLFLAIAMLAPGALRNASAQGSMDYPLPALDSDHDSMSDALEQALLIQFAPAFMVGRNDCSAMPAEFAPDAKIPTVSAEDGTIYGQVFPAKSSRDGLQFAEIHYYHLWKRDCGPHGHHLDTEHVSAMVSAPDTDSGSEQWTALYWYAAAHENTVCDVSQITRASTLDAETHGPRVWISLGKHASYLNEALCQAGCGADRCADMVALNSSRIVNLGEPGHPMNGSDFIASAEWPLLGKMSNTDFPAEPIARLNQLPDTDIAWFHAGKHPAHRVIAISDSTAQTIAGGAHNTTAALSTAGTSADTAISVAHGTAGSAIQQSYEKTKHGVGATARHVAGKLHSAKKPVPPR